MPTLQDVAGDTGIFTDGNWILSENMDANGKYGVIQLKHVGIGEFLGYKDFNFINEKTFNDLRCTEVVPGDVLISRMADPIGRACIVPQLPFPSVTAVDVTIVRIDKNIAEPEFIMHLCNSPSMREKIDRAVRGTTRARITRTELGELEIPLPPLPEQKRIASLLARADRLRQLRRTAHDLGESLLQSVFLEMFGDPLVNDKGWKVRTLRSVSSKFSDGPFGSDLKSEHYVSEGVRVIRLQNIGVGNLIDDDKAYITEEHFAELSKHQCLPGDVIVGTLGDPNLRAIILPPSIPQALNKADCVQIRVNPKICNNQFVCWLLNMPQTLQLASGMIHGQTRARINMGRLAELEVPIPPLNLQEEFAGVVARVESLRGRMSEGERQVEGLFESLLAESFYG